MPSETPAPAVSPASEPTSDGAPVGAMARLDVLKTLGDNTRYAIYLELARSPRPLATAEVAASLDLHPNTVRPHLERMRDVGLLEVSSRARGTVGRPQHHYALSPDAPPLGLEPSPWPTIARMLLQAASYGGLDGADMADAGAEQGRADAGHWPSSTDCVSALVVEQTRLGFDPEVVTDDEGTTIAFAHCPFRELADAHPELVCQLHCGMVEGFVHSLGDGVDVASFHDLADRTPCQVSLADTGSTP